MAWVPPVLMTVQLAGNILNSILEKRTQTKSNLTEILKEMQRFREENAHLFQRYSDLQTAMKEKKLTTYDDLLKHDKERAQALVNIAIETKKFELAGINIAFFGPTSTGKSTMINGMLGKEVAEVGYGETTIKATSYASENCKCTLWDMPGKNDGLTYFTLEYISFWKGLTRLVIVVQNTVKEMTSVTQLLDAINLRYDLIVNKIDQVKEEKREGFKQQIRNEVKECNLKNIDNIWFISAENIQQFDWLKMVAALVPTNRQ